MVKKLPREEWTKRAKPSRSLSRVSELSNADRPDFFTLDRSDRLFQRLMLAVLNDGTPQNPGGAITIQAVRSRDGSIPLQVSLDILLRSESGPDSKRVTQILASEGLWSTILVGNADEGLNEYLAGGLAHKSHSIHLHPVIHASNAAELHKVLDTLLNREILGKKAYETAKNFADAVKRNELNPYAPITPEIEASPSKGRD